MTPSNFAAQDQRHPADPSQIKTAVYANQKSGQKLSQTEKGQIIQQLPVVKHKGLLNQMTTIPCNPVLCLTMHYLFSFHVLQIITRMLCFHFLFQIFVPKNDERRLFFSPFPSIFTSIICSNSISNSV